MSNFSLNNLSHHAYCLIGSDKEGDQLVAVLEKDHGIIRSRNQDFFYSRYESFTIDDARALKLAHEMKPVINNGKKIFIIVADSINTEAQNALLKLLEEPASFAHFFLIIPAIHLLLPTVQSRLFFIENKRNLVDNSTEKENLEEVKKFLKINLAKRLEYVKKLVEEITKEKKNKRDIINFLYFLQKQIRSEKGVKDSAKTLEAIDTALKYANDRSPSLKMLLDYVALNV